MAKIMFVAFLLLVSALPSSAINEESALNPIRRVVNMLQAMQKKVTEEAKKEEALFDKYMCYCKTSGGALQESISAADVKIPQVESAIKEAEETITQLEQDLKDHRASREAAKEAISEATALREKEAKSFEEESTELKTNLKALTGAIEALEKGMAGAFLQSGNAQVLRHLTVDSSLSLSDVDRDLVVSFLAGEQDEAYVPQSGEVTGILKQMKETMEKSLAEVTAEEEEAIKNFDELVAAKTKEIEANTKAIEEKTVRVGNLGVEITQMKNDLDDTAQALLEDKTFLADMDKTCAAKEAEWAEIKKMRAQEQVALAETIKILNDDDALELFKKTLPSPSLVQVVTNTRHLANQALSLVKKTHHAKDKTRVALDLLALALTGKKVNFDKVFKLIDELVAELKTEQSEDDAKKEDCEIKIDATEDKKKGLEHDISDLGAAIEDMTEKIATTTDEIKELEKGIKALDKEVLEQTETRKDEHEEYVELMASDNAAKELLGIAKNRLNKFYNPKLYVPPPKRELTEEERITQNFGGDIGTTPAPGGIAGTGVMAAVQEHSQNVNEVAPPPPPESFHAYAKKGEESSGVIAMIDLLVADLDKEMTEAETTEKNAQKEYEEFMSDSATTRAADAKALTDKVGLKADLEVELQTAKEEKTGKTKELMATAEYESSLHGECDWLLSNFEVRKSARAAEVDSLNKAKAILSGADFSLVQAKRKTVHALRGA